MMDVIHYCVKRLTWQTREKMDNYFAQFYYINSSERMQYLKLRAKQDERLREMERRLDERIAARKQGQGPKVAPSSTGEYDVETIERYI